MRIAILQPYRPDTPPALLDRSADLLDALIAAHPEHQFDLHRAPATSDAGPEKYAPHAAVRNQYAAFLGPAHDYALWVDVDLTDYPADFISAALALNPDGVTAPAVLLEHTETFYDIGGFVEPGGRPFVPHPPYTRLQGPVVDLESVGCLYLAPARLYTAWGLRYRPDGPVYGVEHHSVLSEASRRGTRVVADLSLVARHAYLPRYGQPMR
jgi:hypothetical protein